MYERRHEALLPRRLFIIRQLRHTAITLILVSVSLLIGILGYHFLAHLGWVDSFLNAAMILGGMGPVDTLTSAPAKIFAGCYALFAGLVFLVSAGVLFAPILHRFFHYFHLPVEQDDSDDSEPGAQNENKEAD
jgi:hypothetical protein